MSARRNSPLSHMTCSLCIPLVFVATMGCGSEDFPVVPVSGQVTLDGEPLADAHVGFEPRAKPGESIAGPGSFATTDSAGRYDLRSLDKRKGAVVGTHRVTVETMVVERGPKGGINVLQKEILPKRYHSDSALTFEVPEKGTETADFALTSDK